MIFRGPRAAPGHPGIEPRWTHGDKDGVGTAYSADSRIWFTLWKGCVTEVAGRVTVGLRWLCQGTIVHIHT
jgi:glucoamylase